MNRKIMGMKKIKLLFDVEQLCTDGLHGTGVVRVADILLRKLLENPQLDIYPIITSKRGDFNAYMQAKGLSETLKQKIIYMPKLKATTKNLWWYQSLRSKILTLIYHLKYDTELNKYDAYLSVFSPISPVIYQSNIQTFLIIHDLIPIYYPDGCDAKFIRKFTDWIKRSHPDTYFCVSNYTIKDLRRFKPDTAHIPAQRIYLGADEKFNHITNKKIIKNIKHKYNIMTPKYFLAVSEITTRKNLTHLLKSFVQFLQNTKAEDISLVLVGPIRKGYSEVTSKITELSEYRNKIIQTGYVDDSDLPLLYNGALAFIYPSLYEGFGLPILEAMQCGTPVIATNNTSLPEVGGDAVLYISGQDEEQTAEQLQKIYNNPQIAENLSKKGLQQAQKFNWQITADTITKTIIGVIKNEKNKNII